MLFDLGQAPSQGLVNLKCYMRDLKQIASLPAQNFLGNVGNRKQISFSGASDLIKEGIYIPLKCKIEQSIQVIRVHNKHCMNSEMGKVTENGLAKGNIWICQ